MHASATPAPLAAALVRRPPVARKAQAGWFKCEEAIMGTAVTAELWADDALSGQAALDAVMAEDRKSVV